MLVDPLGVSVSGFGMNRQGWLVVCSISGQNRPPDCLFALDHMSIL